MIGMLWYDNSKSDLATKICAAVGYYEVKYGETASLCLVNPAEMNGHKIIIPGIEVRTDKHVMTNHIWVGKKDGKR